MQVLTQCQGKSLVTASSSGLWIPLADIQFWNSRLLWFGINLPEKCALLVRFFPVSHTALVPLPVWTWAVQGLCEDRGELQGLSKQMFPGPRTASLTPHLSCTLLTQQLEGALPFFLRFPPAWVWYSGLTTFLQTPEDHGVAGRDPDQWAQWKVRVSG